MLTRHHNFTVVHHGYSYTIFQTGFVNITGVMAQCEINLATEIFYDLFNVNLSDCCGAATVDNITASGNFNKKLNLHSIAKYISSSEEVSSILTPTNCVPKKRVFKFNPDYFPGAVLRHFGIGSIIIFASGNFTIVGAKTLPHIQQIYDKTLKIINLHNDVHA